MIRMFLSENGSLNKIEQPQPGCWICLTNPTESELALVSEKCSLDVDTLRAALDEEERSRIEIGDNYNMIVVNIPMIEQRKKEELYTTIPLSIILTKEIIITVCLTDTPILDAFMNGRVRDFYTHMKTRFVLQILYRNATLFLQYLHNIDKKSEIVERKLHGSTQNSELIELLKLEKSLVYFTTALRSNEIVLEKLLRTDNIKKYPEDTDLLEDVIIENKQAIEMANIYSGILSGTMDAFASVISNNLNIVMKFLAIITIVLSIPNIIFSAFGMNLDFSNIPLVNGAWGFFYVIVLTVVICIASAVYFMKKRMFK
ncbi:MAG TPA: magnesium transporter CorA family protein [Bacillota bacterium]|nr:magnesium transporter CorA family protein [Bacillota bacterium]HOK69142.1 magnesium transporter CorA family protein [Bacillota bacterium]HPP84935.1 magnesium transporter CorA family protein [Bacillota bacterium]